MYRDSGSFWLFWQAENQSLREKLLRLGHSPAELQGMASENIIEEASDSIVGKPIINLPFRIVYTTHLCWFYHQKWFCQWPFQDPKLEVPTIYKAYVRPM